MWVLLLDNIRFRRYRVKNSYQMMLYNYVVMHIYMYLNNM